MLSRKKERYKRWLHFGVCMNEESCRFAGYSPPFGMGSMLGNQIKIACSGRHGQQLGCGLIRCRYEELDILGQGRLVGTCHVSLS